SFQPPEEPSPASVSEPAPQNSSLELGSPWMSRNYTDGRFAAYSTTRGPTNKYKENQDRIAAAVLPDAGVVMIAIDGMGGHNGGERAAEIGRDAFYESLGKWKSFGQTIDHMNQAMYADETVRKNQGGAVVAGFHLHPNGTLEVRSVEDAE